VTLPREVMLNIVTRNVSAQEAIRRAAEPSMVLVGDGGTRVTLPFAPLPTDLDNLAPDWETLDRGGMRMPMLVPGAESLATLGFTLTIARPNRDEPIETILTPLRDAARSRQRFSVSYGPQERGLWRITACRITITAREPGPEQRATRATVAMTLTDAGPSLNVGPVTGGVASPPPPAPPARRTYTVVRGDTFWGLAVRYYGRGQDWPRIADNPANLVGGRRIDPRRLPIGKVLVIP
jgi:hypothetical protein